MTLTQELAQALRTIANFPVTGSENLDAYNLQLIAHAAIAKYDAEPPTSRGSEGEAKPVAWMLKGSRVFRDSVYVSRELAENALKARGNDTATIEPLYTAPPPPSQPSAEAWRQAITELSDHFSMDDSVLDLFEARARELHAASCAGVESANSSQP